MKAKDYRAAARELYALRVEMLAIHALRPTNRTTVKEWLEALANTSSLLSFHGWLHVPYTTTYEILRQNRTMILNLTPSRP